MHAHPYTLTCKHCMQIILCRSKKKGGGGGWVSCATCSDLNTEPFVLNCLLTGELADSSSVCRDHLWEFPVWYSQIVRPLCSVWTCKCCLAGQNGDQCLHAATSVCGWSSHGCTHHYSGIFYILFSLLALNFMMKHHRKLQCHAERLGCYF